MLELGKICGVKGVLPKSCALSKYLLGCAYQDTFDVSKVRIRRVKVYPGENPRRSRRCVLDAPFFCSQTLMNPAGVPPGGRNVEAVDASKHRPRSGRNQPLEEISDWMPGRGPMT